MLQLWHHSGFVGATLELASLKADVRTLWMIQSARKGGAGRWFSQFALVRTRLSRLATDHPFKPMALSILRSCGGAFRASSMLSWRPFLIVVLGLLGESIAGVEALDPRYTKRCWPLCSAIAESRLAALERQKTRIAQAAQADEEAAGAAQGEAETTNRSSSSSSSTSDSSDSEQPSSQEESGHADSQTSAPAGSVSPPGSGQADSQTSAPAASSASMPGSSDQPAQSNFGLDAGAARRHVAMREMGRILAARRSSPLQILGVKRKADNAERRQAYRKLALLIHPDKCDHPDAAIAFHVLQDAYDAACPT